LRGFSSLDEAIRHRKRAESQIAFESQPLLNECRAKGSFAVLGFSASDRIALLTERHGHGGVGDIYHNYLIQHLPPHLENVLEIGYGTGGFPRLLAARAQSVVGLDLSSQMIRLAKSQSVNCQNIEFLLWVRLSRLPNRR
jgi:SAM-dependent methyltransferase